MSSGEVLFTPHPVEMSHRVVLGIHVHSHEKVKFILLSSPEREKVESRWPVLGYNPALGPQQQSESCAGGRSLWEVPCHV